MKNSVMLTIASLLSILFFSLHLADDIVRGYEPGTLTNLNAVLIFVFWLYGTLVLFEKRSGYIITLLGGLFALVVPLAHMRGKGVGIASRLANSGGHFFFVWVLFAIGVTGLFSVVLAMRGLWSLRRSSARIQRNEDEH
jgi:heme exporter protein D